MKPLPTPREGRRGRRKHVEQGIGLIFLVFLGALLNNLRCCLHRFDVHHGCFGASGNFRK